MKCLKHGRGTDLFANGDKYSGEYFKGKPHGEGQYVWVNGSYYEGEFREGLKCGKGKWKKFLHSDHSSAGKKESGPQFLYYEGDYLNDKKHGMGVFTWASGNIYRGEYKNDEREGHGEMKWTDGSSYIG